MRFGQFIKNKHSIAVVINKREAFYMFLGRFENPRWMFLHSGKNWSPIKDLRKTKQYNYTIRTWNTYGEIEINPVKKLRAAFKAYQARRVAEMISNG